MRVTLASYDDEPPLGGQGVMLAGMRAALVRREVAVDTVAGRGTHAIRYPNLLHRGPLDFSLQLNRRPSLLTQRNPDVVHALGGPGGVLLLRRLDVPLLYTANHTYRQAHPRGTPKRVMAPLETRAYRRAQTVLALSASTAAALREMGIDGKRVEVSMPGVDVPPDVVSTREERRVLFAGRLEAEKGVLDAVNVMLALLRSGAAASAAVVGTGSLDAEVRERVAAEPGIEVLGTIAASALREQYRRASLVLMPSRYEGLGLVALEAQAMATPVVGYDVDGLRDAVAGDGVLVQLGDRTALFTAASLLLRDPARAAALGESARDRMRSEHAWPVVADRLVEVYDAARRS